ncbi:MAG: tripartite tricarboxylate transporter TctB family protein [Pseudomonadota bacterium]
MSDGKPKLELPTESRKVGDTVFAGICLLFSVFLLWNMTDQTTWAGGNHWSGQPAFWPRLAVIGMTLFSAIYLFHSLRDASGAERFTGLGEEVLRWIFSFEYAAWFMAYVFVTPIIGYMAGSVLFAVALALRVGYRSRLALISAASVGIVTVLLFKSFLQVKIPGGAVYQYLPEALRNFFILYL